MSSDLNILLLTAASVGFIHTVTGPDQPAFLLLKPVNDNGKTS
jgi:hypothetical protein